MESHTQRLAAVAERLSEAWNLGQLERFRYASLDASEMRILRLLPGLGLIRCTLEHIPWPKAKATFTALSYCWDRPPLFPRTIVVDGCRFAVGHNLYSALVALRYHGIQELWVDALCINQDDNGEKSEQVKQMDKIYTYALRVVIWLGDSWDDSGHVMTSIYRGSREDYVKKRFLVALPRLLARSWFTRTWTVQEFVLNETEPLVACGHEAMITWDALSAAFFEAFSFAWHPNRITEQFTQLGELEQLEQEREEYLKERQYLQALLPLVHQFPKHSNLVRRLEWLRSVTHQNSDPIRRSAHGLEHIVHATKGFLVTNPRDKVYGILAMLDPAVRNNVSVDYDKTVLEVFRDVTVYLLRNERRAHVYLVLPVGKSRRHSEPFPSWIPDFAVSLERSPFMPATQLLTSRSIPKHKAEEIELLSCGKRLLVRGLLLDTVQHIVKRPPTRQRIPVRAFPQVLFTWLDRASLYYAEPGQHAWKTFAEVTQRLLLRAILIDYCRALVEIANVMAPVPGAPALEEPLWKTLLAANSNHDEHQDQRGCQITFDTLLAICKEFVRTEKPYAWFISWRRLAQYLGYFDKCQPLDGGISSMFVAGRYFFRGRDGWYGVGEGDVRAGDSVALLFPDANMPFILRKKGDCYEMVGLAYVAEGAKDAAVQSRATEFEKITLG